MKNQGEPVTTERFFFALALCTFCLGPSVAVAQSAGVNGPTADQKSKAVISEQQGRFNATSHLPPPITGVAPPPIRGTGSTDTPAVTQPGGNASNTGASATPSNAAR